MNFSNIRLLRTVKRDTLRLVRSFLDAATVAGAAEVRLTPEQIAQRFVPPLLEPRAFWEGMGAQGTGQGVQGFGDGVETKHDSWVVSCFGQSGPQNESKMVSS